MSIVILGGNECMERRYKDLCDSYRCQSKIFTKPGGGLRKKMGRADLMIFFTGIKTGSLFRAAYEDKKQLLGQIREINQRLREKGLCLLPLRFRNGNALLYLYRPERLKTDLNNELARRTLGNAGYTDQNPGRCVGTLIRRLQDEAEFPHEIGLFLSYPPEDVQGFIDHHARDFKLSGLWKVYGDEAYARAAFAKYKKCTDIYCRSWRAGSSLERLAVAGENPA